MDEGAFRKRLVFRPAPNVVRYGSTSVVTASLSAAAIIFGGTATAAPPSVTDGGTASAAIVFAGGPLTTITLEVSGASPVVFGGAATGFGFVSRTATAGIIFAGTARSDPFVASPIVFGGNATAASSFFTAEVSAPIIFGGSADGVELADATSPIVFGGTVSGTDVSGGTVIATALPGPIVFDGTAIVSQSPTASGVIVFSVLVPPSSAAGLFGSSTLELRPYRSTITLG